MKIYKVLIFILWLFLFVRCDQNKHVTPKEEQIKERPVVITGSFKGLLKTQDSLRIYFGGLVPYNRKEQVMDTMIFTDEQGKFFFTSPKISNLERVTIAFYKKRNGEIGHRYNDMLRDFVVSPGDTIHMSVDKRDSGIKYDFSKSNTPAFEIQWYSSFSGYNSNKSFYQKKGSILRGLNPAEQYQQKIKWGDSVLSRQLGYLKTNRSQLSPKMYAVIKADIIGTNYYYYRNFWGLRNIDLSDNERSKLLQMVNDSFRLPSEPDVMANSWACIRYLSLLPIGKLILEHPEDKDYEFENIYARRYSELCSIWNKEYGGLLREKLFVYNLQNTKVEDTYGFEECLQTGYVLIKSPELKIFMKKWFGQRVRGAAAYSFHLPDTLGNIVSLEDFKGKVVYLDIWFTGCGACRALAKEVDQKVYPKFKHRKDIVFVAISMDKNREQWLNSVASEKYGLKEHVHLYTDGKGMNHPLIKFYGIQGGPTTMIIDKHGKIFSTTPPKIGKSEELISVLKEALKK